MSKKADDRDTIPLCRRHHLTGKDSHHRLQKEFWGHHGIDRAGLITALNHAYDETFGERPQDLYETDSSRVAKEGR